MKKKTLVYVFSIVIAISIVTIVKEKKTTKEIQIQHANFLKNHPYNNSLKLSKKERRAKGMPPNKYYEQEYLLEMNPNTGRTHPENVLKVQKELKQNRKQQRVPGDAADNVWVERGPNNVGGRTRVVLFDPNDASNKRVFAGGITGGLWVNNDITDVNSSWIRVGIDENLAVSCITVDPNDSQIWYLGTGESQANPSGAGNGVWKSTDGGTTWDNVYSDDLNPDLDERLFYINDVVAWNNPTTNKTEVFIGVAGAYYMSGQFPGAKKHGLYKSTDDGANWSWLSPSLPAIPEANRGTYASLYEPNDFEIGPDNTLWIGTERNIYGLGGGTVLKSTNGSTFTVEHKITGGERTEIAVSKSDKNKLYVLCDAGNPVIEVTTDGFVTTSNIVPPSDADRGISAADFTRGQAAYDLVIEVDPTDDSIVYVGGIDLFRSTNNGSSWTQISKWSNNNNLSFLFVSKVHADQHGWAFHPTDPNKAVIGNDGGVFYASSLSEAESSEIAIEARNKDYNVTQFYHGEIGQSTDNDVFLSGAQDNGTQIIYGANTGVSSSIDIYGGDGAYSFIDKEGEYVIVSYLYNTMRRVSLPIVAINEEVNFYEGVTIQDDQNTGRFINPADLDDNLDILYTNASGGDKDSIARYTDIKTNIPVRTNFSNPLLSAGATVVKVSPFTSASTTLFLGTSNGKLLKVLNANSSAPTWSNIGDDVSFTGSVSSIAFGASENEIILTFHNYDVESIWFTTNGGATWSSKEGDFPDIPVKAAMMNPLNNDEVIIGTELGVWRTSNFKDATPNWTQSYNGMSNVKVTSFSLRTADNTVMASTYGRGMFTGQFTTGVASIDEVLNERATFTMYPTVSSGDFTLFAKNTLGEARLQLFDVRGREVYTKQIDFTQQERQSISVNLETGVYIVHLTDASNKKATSKVIIK